MRSVINISLPPQMVKKIKEEVRTSDYATVSEFFRDVLRERAQREKLNDLKKQQVKIAQYIKAYQKYPETDRESRALTKLAVLVLEPEEW